MMSFHHLGLCNSKLCFHIPDSSLLHQDEYDKQMESILFTMQGWSCLIVISTPSSGWSVNSFFNVVRKKLLAMLWTENPD